MYIVSRTGRWYEMSRNYGTHDQSKREELVDLLIPYFQFTPFTNLQYLSTLVFDPFVEDN